MIDDLTSSQYPGVFPDLVDSSLLRLQGNERLWKLYFLRPSWGRETQVEHRIYTKEQADGRISLVSYNFAMPAGDRPTKSDMAFAKDIPKDTLDEIIWNVVRKSQIGPEELEVIDLSDLGSFEEQILRLRGLDEDNHGSP